jgi:hypothetical protein
MKRFILPLLIGLAVLALLAAARNQTRAADIGFSFAVYGDSRSMMYLPYKASEEAAARKLMVDMFELVLPAKVSQEVVDKYVRLTYDPSNNELVQMVMPFDTKSEVTTLTLDKGWSPKPRSRMSNCYRACAAPCSGCKAASGSPVRRCEM